MLIKEQYIFTYDDYLAIKNSGDLCCVAEESKEYTPETCIQGSDDYKNEEEQRLEWKKEIHQKHDKSFKEVLSNKEEMAFLLREFVGVKEAI